MTKNENNDWQSTFRQVYDRGVAAWDAGRKSPDLMFGADDVKFLGSIGCTAQELFDFVDDFRRYEEPDFDTALAITAIRRDYFQQVLHGRATGRVARMEDLPPKTAEVDGLAWLPRLIEKARLKLRGEMPDDLMFGCGGDRAFVQSVNMTLPQVLELARDAGENDRRIIDEVKKCAGRA